MAVIENFAALSEQEQIEFAEALVKTINTEKTFADVNFTISDVGVDDMTGQLFVEATHDDTLEIKRKASWQAEDSESAELDPGYDADYKQSIYEDAAQAFKTLSATLEGYRVSVSVEDVDDAAEGSVQIDNLSHEDSGIGNYEYFGFTGYDSNPYVEVEGTVIKDVICQLTFWVEPAEETAEPAEESEEI